MQITHAVALLAGLAAAAPLAAQQAVVPVAAPTGNVAEDRASIVAAIERARPGDTIQFAPGMYMVGEIINVPTPRVTLLGHVDGTVLRGCDPEAHSQFPAAVFACNGLELTGGHQTVRNLTFEWTWHGLHIGCCNVGSMEEFEAFYGGQRREPSVTGGYRIEGNTFRNSQNGIRVVGEGDEPTTIRGNRFINTYHALVINGRTAHFLDNDVAVPEPESVPYSGHPGGAIAVTSFQLSDDPTACADNVIAGNRIEGHPDAISIMAFGPGITCRNNQVRDNTIIVRRSTFRPWMGVVVTDTADATVVGVAVALLNLAAGTGASGPSGQPSVVEGNVIEGNRIVGAEGIAIEVLHASGNRIANNIIEGVQPRTPFPGNTLGMLPGLELGWRDANGAAIWLSVGSNENDIEGNRFDGLAADAIVVAGDRNRVQTRGSTDAVRDLGSDNRVSTVRTPEADHTAWTDPSPHTVRFVTVEPGVRLEVLDWGGTGEPMVLLAGMSATAHTFDSFAPKLTDQFRVLAITRRGFGASSQPDSGYNLDRLTDDVRVVLDSDGIQRATLVGHSYGVTEIMHFASRWPQRVARLVNIDGMLVVDPDRLFAAMGAVPGWPTDDADRASVAAFRAHMSRAYGVELPQANHHLYISHESEVLAQIRTFSDAGPPASSRDPVDTVILDHMAELGIPGVSVAVLRGTEVLKVAAYGKANVELGVPASHETVFPLASITKAFTGTAVMRLVERGRLRLDDRIVDFLPELPEAWSAVTVRQLLSHTSGLPDVAVYTSVSNAIVLRDMLIAPTLDSAMAVLPTLPLQFAAGQGTAYNQTNYMLLALLLERLDGRTIEETERDDFARPLGLTSLAFGDSRAVMRGRASGYTRMDYSTGRPELVPVRPLWIEYPDFLYTAAGLNGTALDLARFVAAVGSGNLLGEAARDEMWTIASLADGSPVMMGPYGVALGWFFVDAPSARFVHVGGGESVAVRHYVPDGLTVAVLTNLQGADPYKLIDAVAELYMVNGGRP